MSSATMATICNETASTASLQHSSNNNKNTNNLINNNPHSSKHLTMNGKCSCCPFGYHLDLDFVQYCENLKANASSKRNALNGGDASAAVRKRQRKSMEVMLGVELADFSSVWDKVLVSFSIQ